MRVFLVVFIILSIAIFGLHFQKTIYADLTQPWTVLLAKISAALVILFDTDVYATGTQILTDPAKNSQHFLGVNIVAGCNGIEAWLVLVAGIMAFPPYSRIKFYWIVLGVTAIMLSPFYWHSWLAKVIIVMVFLLITQLFSPLGWYKISGVFFGFIAIQILNIVRVISLFYIGQWHTGLFDFAHLYVWQALIILDAFIVFLFWLSRMPHQHHDDEPDYPPANTMTKQSSKDKLASA